MTELMHTQHHSLHYTCTVLNDSFMKQGQINPSWVFSLNMYNMPHNEILLNKYLFLLRFNMEKDMVSTVRRLLEMFTVETRCSLSGDINAAVKKYELVYQEELNKEAMMEKILDDILENVKIKDPNEQKNTRHSHGKEKCCNIV